MAVFKVPVAGRMIECATAEDAVSVALAAERRTRHEIVLKPKEKAIPIGGLDQLGEFVDAFLDPVNDKARRFMAALEGVGSDGIASADLAAKLKIDSKGLGAYSQAIEHAAGKLQIPRTKIAWKKKADGAWRWFPGKQLGLAISRMERSGDQP
jgi:hypothetical protein